MLKANSQVESALADVIARKIKSALEERVVSPSKISKATLTTSLSAHIVLEAVADSLGVDRREFKDAAGYGQPSAYFI